MLDVTKCIEELEQSGFSQEQARVSLSQWIKLMNENLTTKVEMKELEFALRTDMKAMETSIRKDMKESMNVLETSIRSDMKEMKKELRSFMRWSFGILFSLFVGIYLKLFFG